MSNARKLADNLPSVGQLSGRNAIINGEMRIAERGTSFDTNGTSATTLKLIDRWAATRRATSGALTFDATVTQSTDSPTGFSNSLKVDVDTAQTPTGSDNAIIHQNIAGEELQRFGWGSSDAKAMTISFWVKSNKTGTYCIQPRYTGLSDSGLFEYSISSSGVWEHKTLTFPANTTASFANNSDLAMQLMFHLAVGSGDHAAASSSLGSSTYFRATSNQVNLFDNASNYWQITGVQMEVGSQASPFEHEPVGVTLRKAQRYYQEIYMFHDAGSSYLRETIPFRTTMRAAPTGYVYARRPDGTGTNTVSKIYQGGGETSAGISNQTTNSARLDSAGYTANVDIYGRVTLDAEI